MTQIEVAVRPSFLTETSIGPILRQAGPVQPVSVLRLCTIHAAVAVLASGALYRQPQNYAAAKDHLRGVLDLLDGIIYLLCILVWRMCLPQNGSH